MSEIIRKKSELAGEEYYYTKHKSGLEIYLIPKKMSSVYAILGVKYGSIYDRFKKRSDDSYVCVPDGVAHFLEHKMFENEDGVDTFERFSALGAQANAYTTFGLTAYLFSCTRNFDRALDTLLDFVTHPYFTEENVSKEQGIIAQEIRMGDDNPGRALIFGMLNSMYKNCNVAKEVAGTVESISEITPALLYDCYRVFYNLNNMILCVSGDLTMDDILASADRVLDVAEPFDIEFDIPDEQESVVRDVSVRKMQVANPLFAIGIKNSTISPDPSERMRQAAAISVILDTLFGKSSEFFNSLYENGYLSGNIDIWDEHESTYSFACLSGEGRDPDHVYDVFKKICADAVENGLDAEEFTRCKRVFYAGLVSSFDSTEEIANNLLDYAVAGEDIFEDINVFAELDIAYVNEMIKKLFVEDHFTLMKILPLEEEQNDC